MPFKIQQPKHTCPARAPAYKNFFLEVVDFLIETINLERKHGFLSDSAISNRFTLSQIFKPSSIFFSLFFVLSLLPVFPFMSQPQESSFVN